MKTKFPLWTLPLSLIVLLAATSPQPHYVGGFASTNGTDFISIDQGTLTGTRIAVTTGGVLTVGGANVIANGQTSPVTVKTVLPTTNLVAGGTITLDFTQGNYQFITSAASLAIAGFANMNANNVNWVVLSYSNSGGSSQTFTWPTPAKIFATNGITTAGATRSVNVPTSAVVKATFSYDPHGTNACVLVSF